MSFGDLFHDGGGLLLVPVEVVNTPTSLSDDVDLLIDHENGDLHRTAAGWSPKPGPGGTQVFPQAGVPGLAGIDSNGEAWLIMWSS